ncbi:hypothetical protein SAMN05720606_101107 [Paenibacillus polysaccharolyticus]|uniref:Uncharacterized protein n=2 Tax=Paenibacillus polysaccharolyticus TaxID=582692 RepID=A0A1G5AUC7_9BACL|nr:hypothetical protein SAMN05720606_101107 [Paenibacillus polysaccharolyticus]
MSMNKKIKVSHAVIVLILAIAVGYGISANKEETFSHVSSTSAVTPFKFTASAMKKSLIDSGYEVRNERLETLDAYVGIYQQDKLEVRFDIYHTRDNDQIDWVEVLVDASGYIDLNNLDAPTNPKVVEATTKAAAEVFKFPFFSKDSEEFKTLTAWVDSNASKPTKKGKLIETKIGDLYFTMYGQPYMRFLEITTKRKE